MFDYAIIHHTLLVLAIAAVILLNTTGVFLVALQMPGTWLMLLATSLLALWRWDTGGIGAVSGWVLLGLLGLAILGEILEFIAGAVGARNAGASKRGTVGAIIGSIAGAIAGLIFLAFIPIIGVLIGAAIGAAAGSILGDLWAGRQWHAAIKGGQGAAIGKFCGALSKLIIAALMWLAATVAIFWP